MEHRIETRHAKRLVKRGNHIELRIPKGARGHLFHTAPCTIESWPKFAQIRREFTDQGAYFVMVYGEGDNG